MPIDSPSPQHDPEREYGRRLELLKAEAARHKRRDAALVRATLILLVACVLTAALLLTTKILSIYWTLVPIILVISFAIAHERVIRGMRTGFRAIAFYEQGLARIGNQWAGKGESGERFLDTSHPYSRDLDLFGKGSVFELLCAARTRAGQETLASWLLAPAPPEEVILRNAAVFELQSRLALREDLAVASEDVRSEVQPEALASWGEASPLLQSGVMRIVLPFLTSVWLFGLAAWAAWDNRAILLLASAVNLSVSYKFKERTTKSVSSIEGAARELKLLAKVFARLERETFQTAKMRELSSCLQKDGFVASRSLMKLNHLLDCLLSRRNLVLATLDRFLFWSLQISFGIEAWRSRFGPQIRRWLAAVGQIEALSDLAAFSYEHPENVFPEFARTAPSFEAEGLAHPLIPANQVVRNDVRLGDDLRLMIISGPNMAGKSTFLRAMGVNAVLAQCGAPVCARKLRLSQLKVAASVCILDSLQGGISRFYAEISRLKLILDLTTGPVPVLFLLDELLQGTNSHDRRIGAEAIVRSLFKRHAIGLVTTHDLALAEIADSLGSGAANFHFEDRLEDGALLFDHRLSPGIVQTSNALDLMRSIGLDV